MGTGIKPLGVFLEESIPITKTTWYISISPGSCYPPVQPFNGHISKAIPESVKNKLIESGTLKNIENLVIAAYLYEPSSTGDMTEWVQKSLDYLNESNFFPNLKNVHVLYDSMLFNDQEIKSKYNVKKTFLPYYLLRSTLYKDRGTKLNVTAWLPNGKRALFLIGDGLRINRFPVLYEFYRNNDLTKLEYSLDYNYINRFDNIQEYFNDVEFKKFANYMHAAYNLSTDELKKKIKLLQRKLIEDNFNEKVKSKQFNHFDISAYYFPKVWHTSSLILTMETQFLYVINDQPRSKETNTFTEKLWKPISTKKPFILCSNQDYQYSILESMGFKTFLEYTSHPNKITHALKDIPSFYQSHYPKLTYERTCSFLNNMIKYEKQIANDVEYNYNLWLKMGKELWKRLYNECPWIKEIPKNDIADLCILGGECNYITDPKTLTRLFS